MKQIIKINFVYKKQKKKAQIIFFNDDDGLNVHTFIRVFIFI